jgi:hypothetical protein
MEKCFFNLIILVIPFSLNEKIRKENIVEGGSEEVEDNNNILVQQ